MQIFQIFNGFCHWRTPFKSMEETKNFPADCIFVEAPDYVNEQWGYDETKEGDERFIRPEPPEGWIYDEESGTFVPQDMIPVLLSEAQERKQAENKEMFAHFLATHPLTWIDGKTYGITMEDQTEINLNLNNYRAQVEVAEFDETVTPVLEWHAQNEPCVGWTYEDLCSLLVAINNAVHPWFQKFNEYKGAIYGAETRTEVEEIELVYKTEEELAAEQRPEEEEEEVVEEKTTESTEETPVEETPAEEVPEEGTVTE